MKKILFTLILIGFGQISWGQCTFSLTASDTLICPGDTVNIAAAGPITDLQTTFAAGNNHRGNMFDITAINSVIIEGFDAHPMGNTTIEIYYKTGSYAGSENNAAAWTFVGSAAVVAQPTGTPTPIPVNVGVTIPAGQTYAFYVTSNNTGVSLNYTNGTTAGNVYASDANIQFLEGCGLEYPFSGSPFSPRIWNGIIHYSPVAGASYLWNTGATTSAIDVTPMSTTTYTVDITASGCSTFTDSVQINVSDINIDLGADIDLCAGDSVMLNAGNPGATYEWNGDSLLTQQVYTVNTGGTYWVDVMDTIGCMVTDTLIVTEHALPVVDLGADTTFCNYNTLSLDAGSGFASYQWSNAETTASILLDGPTLGNGTYAYSVVVTDSYGCIGMDSIMVTVDPCAGLNELKNSGVNVYPNPTKGMINIDFSALGNDVDYRVYTQDGKLMEEGILSGANGNIDISELDRGGYLLEISTKELNEVIHITKQ